MENNHLSRPLLPTTTTLSDNSPSSDSTIIIRLSTVLFIGIISIWANFAVSTPFRITIINDIQPFPARNRFNIFYISDDKATRIIQNTTSFIQNILHPNNEHLSQMQKNIGHLTLRIATAATTDFTVKTDGTFHELLMNVSVPLIMGDIKKLDYAIKSMVLEGTARIAVGDGRAPPWMVDGVVEYIKRVGGYGDDDDGTEFSGDFCLGGDKDPRVVGQVLEHYESIREGFIQRLRERWDDRTVENALWLPIKDVCDNVTYIFVEHSSN
ncbi:uncharacterized protein [Euphorbia lathyris]|uniref:uncharacterized protein n=1 Tax=Euphorbia lathyris TaxID=212925 RepID=UPI003313A6F7